MSAARSWHAVPFEHGRTAIFNALRIDRSELSAAYATAAFRIVMDDGINWIAGAIGCQPCLDIDRLLNWYPDDITSVILWNPKLNEVRIMGEAKTQPMLVHGSLPHDELTIYGTGFPFFRAWADQRAATFERYRANLTKQWKHKTSEPVDGDCPGALAVGNLDKITWRELNVPLLNAGPGIDAKALSNAVYRAARIPRVNSNIRMAA